MDTKILDELEAAYAQELSLAGDDLGTLEAAVEAKMRQLGQGLLQRLVRRQPNGYQGACAGGFVDQLILYSVVFQRKYAP
ncbi:MAG: hypothetical protein AMJ79_07505 [Phycisphaerae bacterium SM23_30]|nr:MAG: hypothetical protein AMJ79_07505 [Phycisphaerae bacterium SM23_30]